MSIEVVFTSHLDEIEGALPEQLEAALEEIGLVAEGYAKRLCPVDTERLRNSIAHTADDRSAYIGTNVEYAPYVEMGTSRTRAQPYLRPAVEDHKDVYKTIVRNHMEE